MFKRLLCISATYGLVLTAPFAHAEEIIEEIVVTGSYLSDGYYDMPVSYTHLRAHEDRG